MNFLNLESSVAIYFKVIANFKELVAFHFLIFFFGESFQDILSTGF